MTGTNDKLRALFLTALMVVSVFGATVAFTGAAAAAANANLDAAAEYDDSVDADGGDIELAFTDASGTVTVNNANVYIDGAAQGNMSIGTAGPTVVLQDDTWGYGDLKPASDVVVKVTYTDNAGTTTENISVQVTSQNVDIDTGDSTPVYQGEPVALVGATSNDNFDIIRNGAWFTTNRLGTNSNVFVFDTSGRDVDANWTIDNGGTLSKLELRNLGLSVNPASGNLTSNQRVSGTVEARAPDRDVAIWLEDSNGNVVAGPVNPNTGGDNTASYSFAPQDEGDYTVMTQDLATGNTASADVSVSGVVGRVTLTETVPTEHRGDIVRIPLNFEGGASKANLTLGSSEVSFIVAFNVSDNDGDGSATILWNTARSNKSNAGISVEGGTLTQTPQVNIIDGVSDPVEAAEYPLSVVTTDSGTETGLATVIIDERGSTSLSTHTAPSGANIQSDDTVSDVQNISSGTDVGSTVAVDPGSGATDWVILRLEASGLEGYVPNATVLGGGHAQSNGVSLTVTEDDETVRKNQDPISLVIDNSNATLVADAANDLYYVVFKASELTTRNAEVNDQFNVEFAVEADDSPVATEDESLTTSFTLVQGDSEFDLQGDTLFVESSDSATITGTSTWAPGTALSVNLRSVGGQSPFTRQNNTITVSPAGTWMATFDLSDQSEGQTFSASLLGPAGTEDEADGVIGSLTAAVSFSDQTAGDAGTLVTVDSVTLSQGGFVAIHQGGASGPVIGVSDYLSSGPHSDVSIRLREAIDGRVTLVAMAHKDTDGDKTFDFIASDFEDDGPYMAAGSAVTSSATVGVTTPTPSPEPGTPTATPEPGTPTPTPTSPTPSPTPTTTPGFGLAVALLALIAAALLAIRRD